MKTANDIVGMCIGLVITHTVSNLKWRDIKNIWRRSTIIMCVYIYIIVLKPLYIAPIA